MTAHDLVLVEVADRVATVVLNRPEVRNALNGELIDALTARLAECEASDDVDVMILTGVDPAFCAGLDLAYLATRVDWNRESTPTASRPFPYRRTPSR